MSRTCTTTSRRRRLTLSLGIAVLAALSLSSVATATGPRSAAERGFLTDMVGHHAMAVEMARMAQEKAMHPELKTAADKIVSTQTAEIDRMQSWLKAWYGRKASTEMGHGDMEQMAMLEQATGAEFEVRFLAMMSVHHTQALERARVVRSARIHPATRRLTGDIIRAQRREIAQFEEWLVAWYAN
jgi:uncharacterized protein (DUF305 family)